ncbi:transporter substrate-binding domain-containing protein [uncultured Devosia sp.]|uniref:amino acid ABC transporter substrate-binding protein n=1 Tax=uncultured Devosia sp. TaxID=211434 RepID=UPI0035CB242B
MQNKLAMIALTAALGLVAASAQADTLADVKARGFVQCGVTEGVPGFSLPDANNEWSGLDVDYCRAVASAIFNDPKAVRFTPTTSTDRFNVLGSGEVDLLARTTTWTMTRDTTLGLMFVGTMFYDGQGFLVRKADGIASAADLSGAAVCIEAGTTTELNAADYFSANNLEFNPVTFTGQDEVLKAFEDGRCDVMTSDSSQLAGNRGELAVPDDYALLPEIISKEPLAIVVRQGDDLWFEITRWVYYTLLESEELGVTQTNVDEMLGSDNPGIKRLLGVEGDFGTPIGLTKDWAYQVVKGTGNYGEIFERNVGANTPLALPRGLNALWNEGGIQYSPPIR